ncbi:hypothetical protein HN415_01050, partial [Candidatus Woesearchaeota archaeon]|nr:hypothetical protein [Candidatus Woesearchaeota archaeon]
MNIKNLKKIKNNLFKNIETLINSNNPEIEYQDKKIDIANNILFTTGFRTLITYIESVNKKEKIISDVYNAMENDRFSKQKNEYWNFVENHIIINKRFKHVENTYQYKSTTRNFKIIGKKNGLLEFEPKKELFAIKDYNLGKLFSHKSTHLILYNPSNRTINSPEEDIYENISKLMPTIHNSYKNNLNMGKNLNIFIFDDKKELKKYSEFNDIINKDVFTGFSSLKDLLNYEDRLSPDIIFAEIHTKEFNDNSIKTEKIKEFLKKISKKFLIQPELYSKYYVQTNKFKPYNFLKQNHAINPMRLLLHSVNEINYNTIQNTVPNSSLIFSGTTGKGKTTFAEEYIISKIGKLSRDVQMVTTRLPRIEDLNNQKLIFVTNKQFDELINNEVLELDHKYPKIKSNKYGFLKSKKKLCSININYDLFSNLSKAQSIEENQIKRVPKLYVVGGKNSI